MEKYPIQFVLLIEADTEDELHNHRNGLRSIGVNLPSYQEDEDGGLWKCIGNNIYHLNSKREVINLVKQLHSLPYLLFEDSSVIMNYMECRLAKLLSF